MSGISWRNGFALGLIGGIGLTVLLSLWLGSAREGDRSPIHASEYCADHGEKCPQESERFGWVWSTVQRFVASEDTLAQWLMAAFGVLATSISAYAVYLLRDTLKATRDAVVEAEKGTVTAQAAVVVTENIGKAQLRAYMGFSGVKIQPVGDQNDITFRVGFQFIFYFRNVGSTPANKVLITGDYDFIPRGSPVRLLEASDHPPEEALGGYNGTHIGPGQDIGGASVYFTMETLLGLRGSQNMLVITGRVDYLDAFNERHFARTSNALETLTDEDGLRDPKRPFETMFGFLLYGNGNQGD